MAKKRKPKPPAVPFQANLFKEVLPEKSAKELREIQRSLPTTRQRDIQFPFPNWSRKQTYPSGNSITHSSSGTFDVRTGIQVTVSEGHPFPAPKGAPLRDLGGDFTTTKQYIEDLDKVKIFSLSNEVVYSPTEKQTDIYIGPVFPVKVQDPSLVPFPPDGSSDDNRLNQLGATAIARCKPTNSVADLATFLGETMKDGLPAILGHQTWKAKTSRAKLHSSGGEFLNVQFGWLPMVSDIKKFSEAVRHANTVIEQFERDAGRVVRRQYRFPTNTQREEEVITNQLGPFFGSNFGMSLFYNSPLTGKIVRTRETVQRQWFSGAFTYYLPIGDDNRSSFSRNAHNAKKLFGIELTPNTLWELSPWSWAIDWFSNTGDVISNLTDSKTDGLVLRYGYIMEHTVVRDTYTLSESNLKGSDSKVPPVTLVTETKKRRRANPFGFGISWDGLSPLQLAIAAALGISRSG
jgi:hypothetical protein